MKKVLLLILLLPSITFSADINVEISNINNNKGIVSIGLFNTENSFPKEKKTYKAIKIDAITGVLNYQFSHVPSGEYAIAIYHDENENNKLDKNFLGIPKEGFGFSNNAKAIFGPPPFYKAKFKLRTVYQSKIHLKY